MVITQLDEPSGFSQAIHAMRNPMDSWDKSDSKWIWSEYTKDKTVYSVSDIFKFEIGEKDKDLSIRLQQAGPEHCKHLRMIFVYADIKAPRYWWNEFDTYRNGVEKVSCSTMHKLMARPLSENDFQYDASHSKILDVVISKINSVMEFWGKEQNPAEKKRLWRSIIQILPQSYLQQRTVCMSYAALRNIVRQREGHKLSEWQQFIDWCKTLPNSWMIFE